jgi:hypothetical protein
VTASAHVRYEEVLAEAMLAPDPVARLRRAARDPALSLATRRALAAADEDGIRLAALLVARLRFERLMQGSQDASDFFERDPAAFSDAFRQYHHAVRPTECFPMGEARLWSEWRARASSPSSTKPTRRRGARKKGSSSRREESRRRR